MSIEPIDENRRQSGRPSEITPRGHGWLAAAGMVGAAASASCCVAPLVLFSLGVGGAWIGNLTVLAPYQPIFIVLTLGILGAGFWRVYGRRNTACEKGSGCAGPGGDAVVKSALWTATVLVAAAVAFPFAAPGLLALL